VARDSLRAAATPSWQMYDTTSRPSGLLGDCPPNQVPQSDPVRSPGYFFSAAAQFSIIVSGSAVVCLRCVPTRKCCPSGVAPAQFPSVRMGRACTCPTSTLPPPRLSLTYNALPRGSGCSASSGRIVGIPDKGPGTTPLGDLSTSSASLAPSCSDAVVADVRYGDASIWSAPGSPEHSIWVG